MALFRDALTCLPAAPDLFCRNFKGFKLNPVKLACIGSHSFVPCLATSSIIFSTWSSSLSGSVRVVLSNLASFFFQDNVIIFMVAIWFLDLNDHFFNGNHQDPLGPQVLQLVNYFPECFFTQNRVDRAPPLFCQRHHSWDSSYRGSHR